MSAFHIRKAMPNEDDGLFDVWWRSVCATHSFVGDEDLLAFASLVRACGLARLDTWVLYEAAETAIGFLVLTGSHVEALFIAPDRMRCGGGSLLIDHARALRGRLSVDVNEQNAAGLAFYLARGFSIVGRSDQDGTGRPYPLLHLAEPEPRRVACDQCRNASRVSQQPVRASQADPAARRPCGGRSRENAARAAR